MYKTIVAPIVATIAIVAQLIFGVDIGEEVQSQIVEALVNVIAVGAILYGIITNHKREDE
mgnify:FL=1